VPTTGARDHAVRSCLVCTECCWPPHTRCLPLDPLRNGGYVTFVASTTPVVTSSHVPLSSAKVIHSWLFMPAFCRSFSSFLPTGASVFPFVFHPHLVAMLFSAMFLHLVYVYPRPSHSASKAMVSLSVLFSSALTHLLSSFYPCRQTVYFLYILWRLFHQAFLLLYFFFLMIRPINRVCFVLIFIYILFDCPTNYFNGFLFSPWYTLHSSYELSGLDDFLSTFSYSPIIQTLVIINWKHYFSVCLPKNISFHGLQSKSAKWHYRWSDAETIGRSPALFLIRFGVACN